MKCPKCGVELPENSNFCTACGESIKSEGFGSFTAGTTETPAFTAGTSFPGDTAGAENKPESFFKKNLKVIIAAAAIVVVAIIAIVAISSCSGAKEYDYTKAPILFNTDDGVSYVRTGKKDAVVLADDDEFNGSIKLSEDGKRIFYKFDGELYFRKTSDKDEDSANDGAVRVAKKVDTYNITPDGKKVIYRKDSDWYRVKAAADQQAEKIAKDVVDIYYTQDLKTYVYKDSDGDLFVAKNFEDKNKVSKDGKCIDFWFSGNDKKVLFIERNDDGEKTLYNVGLGKNDKPEVLAKNVDDYVFLNEDGTELYYTVAERNENTGKNEVELFYKKGSKDKVKVAEDVVEVIDKYKDEDDTFYLVTGKTREKDGVEVTEKKLFKLNGAKEPVEICADFDYYTDDMAVVVQFENKDRKDDQSYDDWMDSCTTYNMFIKDKLYPFELEKTDGDWQVIDGKFYVIEDAMKKEKDSDYYTYNEKGGTLVEYKIGGKGLERKNGKTICDDVTGFELVGIENADITARYGDVYIKDVNKKMILIDSGDDKLVYVGGKTTELEDYEGLVAIEGKTIYYYGDRGSDGYCIFKFSGSKIETLAEDVKDHLYVSSKYIYFINDDEELCRIKKAGKYDVISDDAISFVGYPVVITESDKFVGTGAYSPIDYTEY